jgi:hypothetical protein
MYRPLCHGKYSPVWGSVTPLPVLIYRGFLLINLQLTRASKTAIPLRETLPLTWLRALNRAVLVIVLFKYTREALLACFSLLV